MSSAPTLTLFLLALRGTLFITASRPHSVVFLLPYMPYFWFAATHCPPIPRSFPQCAVFGPVTIFVLTLLFDVDSSGILASAMVLSMAVLKEP